MSLAANLIEKMTLAEKIGQLTMVTADYAVTGPVVAGDVTADLKAGKVGSLFNLFGREPARRAQRIAVEETRLGIPLFFGHDVIHGFRTIFPVPLAEAGAFEATLWRRTAAEAAAESAAAGLDLTFAPMLDIARDPRWGRGMEGPGEDPVLASRIAEAKVTGFQDDPDRGVVATAKHYVGYGASVAGRDYAAVDLSDRALHEVYLPPFRAAVAAGVGAIMPAFTDLAGLPLTAHRALIEGTLRRDWGYDGLVISDYGAIGELIPHGVAGDLPEAAALALNAGVDLDMMAYAYEKGLPEALERGLVAMETVNAAVARVLAFKERLGLFENPYRRCGDDYEEPAAVIDTRRAVAREAAEKSIVLLKTDGLTLPLPPEPGRIALIGPLADAGEDMLGAWCAAGRDTEQVSVLAGLTRKLATSVIEHCPGVSVAGTADDNSIAAAVEAARAADHIVLALGESADLSGEAASRATIALPGQQAGLAEAILALDKPVIVLLFAGRPLVLPEALDKAAALLMCWHPGSEAGSAIANILMGDVNPSAGLAVTWPRHVGQVPIHHAMRQGGRPLVVGEKYTSQYLDMSNDPAFAFGHGLSYTAFSLTEPTVEVGEAVRVRVTLANVGERSGAKTVFVFLRDPVASLARPVLELKAFEKATLRPGDEREMVFMLGRADLAFVGQNLEWTVEAGAFEVHVGFSADPAGLRTARFRLDDPERLA